MYLFLNITYNDWGKNILKPQNIICIHFPSQPVFSWQEHFLEVLSNLHTYPY